VTCEKEVHGNEHVNQQGKAMNAGTERKRTQTAMDLRRQRLLEMVLAETASIDDLVNVIRDDHELTRMLVHAANTGLPGHRSPVQRLKEAVVLVGLRRVRSIVEGLQTTA
jgi:HD-like signal output (HDOD) protein